ncbi:Mob1/phocein [Dichomitus squalens]|nr:Mob1/phocein [Dichomitus squalens]
MTVVIQRPLKGSRISSFYPVKSLPPLSALDSAFQLQEYISLLIRLDVHDVDRIVSIPGRSANDSQDGGDGKEEKDGERDGSAGVNVDEACWVYEQLRRLAQDLSHPLITMLQQECTRSTCPEMKAGEWLYLCVAHGNEGAMEQCCAIDYILHTLDSATALLNSPRAFPSRLSVPPSSHRHFSSLARRLGRIFAHAYFHHREAFEQAEAESSLYARFLALTSKFDLVPAEFLVIPPRLSAMGDDGRPDHVEPPRLLGASLDPRRDLSAGAHGDPNEWSLSDRHVGRERLDDRSSPAPPSARRNESPRKFGRNRTDTMVYSEAFSVAEELAKGDLSEVDIDREIEAERAAAAVGADIPTSAAADVATTASPVDESSPLGPEEQEEEREEEASQADVEAPVEKAEPEHQNEAAEEPSSQTEEPGAPQTADPAPEAQSALGEEEATEETHAQESASGEAHEEPQPQTEESASAPAAEATAAEAEPTGATSAEHEEEEEEEEEAEEEDSGEEEEESSDEESDVSSTVVGVVNEKPASAPEAETAQKEEGKEGEEPKTEKASPAEGERTEES